MGEFEPEPVIVVLFTRCDWISSDARMNSESSKNPYRGDPPIRNSQFPKWAEFKGDLGPSKTDNFKKYTGDCGYGPVLINERLGFYLVIRHLITWFWISYLILFGATAIVANIIEASP